MRQIKMTKLEKVIKGLECCDGYCDDETGCPYFDELEPFDCQEQLRADAIALLKALEPRVMTRAELELAKLAPVWLDTYRNKIYNGWALCYDIQTGMGITGTRAGITDPSGRVHWLKLDDYGRTWRCWTSRPDEKRRTKTPWES